MQTIQELLNNHDVPTDLQRQFQQGLLNEAEFMRLATEALRYLEDLRDDHIQGEISEQLRREYA